MPELDLADAFAALDRLAPGWDADVMLLLLGQAHAGAIEGWEKRRPKKD